MRRSTFLAGFLAASVALMAVTLWPLQEATAERPAAGPVVAELFTSQGCSSCPPAERYFSELAEREDVLAIEWHVDYWDRLVHGGSRWQDPYSDAAYTARQRSYNRAIRGTGGVYTPQAVINGQTEAVGNDRSAVNRILLAAAAPSINVSIAASSTGHTISLDGEGPEGDVVFLRLLKDHKTDVKGGENKGRVLSGKNIVLEAIPLGDWTGQSVEFTGPTVSENETCAVIVQEKSDHLGAIVGAGVCPA